MKVGRNVAKNLGEHFLTLAAETMMTTGLDELPLTNYTISARVSFGIK